METIYSKKDHQEINTSVLFKSSEFKESVMKLDLQGTLPML
jgi:hypothetical protein